ncbi:acetyltransferase [Flavobacterium sp.]|uniref:acetyltransferase n=1 Tax=Flavobacterium sp. TaxID=239 RepID=UPI0039E2870E
MKTLAIIGSGHLGQQIAHYAIADKHYGKVVFFDDVTAEKSVNGHAVLGTSDAIESAYARQEFDEILIGIGYKHLNVRAQLFERFDGKIPFGQIVHSSVWVDPTAQIAAGCVIYPGGVIDAHAKISENTILNVSCTIAHDTTIGKHCFLSPRVAVAGFVTTGQQCILGINSTIIDNISMVAHTQIGGGTVVIKNIENPGLYVGNPHKFIR